MVGKAEKGKWGTNRWVMRKGKRGEKKAEEEEEENGKNERE